MYPEADLLPLSALQHLVFCERQWALIHLEGLAARLHELTEEERTPPARYEKKCKSCSLVSVCLPKSMGIPSSTREYLDGFFNGLPR